MARSRYSFKEHELPHFLTDTIVRWQPAFNSPQRAQIILDSFAHLQNQHGLKLFGYVILENHIHWIAQHPQLPQLVQNFKSFTAKQIISNLQESGARDLLSTLAFAKIVSKKDSHFQVWQEGSHPKAVTSLNKLNDMLDYIHYNPVKRGYVDDPVHWRYSSARNFEELPGLIEIYRSW